MRKILLIGACVALTACGGAEREAADDGEAYEDRETVFDPMTETIDRAKEVEEMGRDRKKAMDEALEDAEGRSE
ncbi:MAG: hypothetical protein GVY21_01075 [Gammaproteobacteria bacterium]|jgi:hypothetical protein|nr:hypothetical protein [Gammaproteobacteria bacterium]